MSVDEFARTMESLSRLVGAIVWPAVTVFVLIRFGSDFRSFFSNLSEFTLKGAGFEASAKRKQAEAAAALTAAAAARPEEGTTPDALARQARAAAAVVADSVTPSLMRRAERSTVLWVDDNPTNNVHERHSLEALGIDLVISTSTEDALQKLAMRPFDAIISDMGRPPDPRAGYTLLDKVRARGDRTPFIIYAGSRAPEHQAEARQRGALGCTNRPNELFEMVLSVLGRRS